MPADEPDDALAVEVFLEPLNRRDPSEGIDDLVNGAPRFCGGTGPGNIEHQQGYPKRLEVGPNGGR